MTEHNDNEVKREGSLKSMIQKVPFVSELITWCYRLFKLPTKFHQLNDDFWKLYGRTEQMEIMLNKTVDHLEELKSRAAFLSRDLEMLHRELKQSAGISIEETVKKIANKEFLSETYQYFAFENRFRGSPEDIRKNQMPYVEMITKTKEKSKGEYLLDVGCGRGEFLKLLREFNVSARGVDGTKAMIDACNEQKLDAQLQDILQYLGSVRNQTLIGITAFQVVEHLPVNDLIEFIKVAAEKVAPEGIIILETVNPLSFTSLANFYMDLTHHNPIPPKTLGFLVENAGFKNVTTKFTSDIPDNFKLKGEDENIRKLNELLFGPQDYAVIGWK